MRSSRRRSERGPYLRSRGFYHPCGGYQRRGGEQPQTARHHRIRRSRHRDRRQYPGVHNHRSQLQGDGLQLYRGESAERETRAGPRKNRRGLRHHPRGGQRDQDRAIADPASDQRYRFHNVELQHRTGQRARRMGRQETVGDGSAQQIRRQRTHRHHQGRGQFDAFRRHGLLRRRQDRDRRRVLVHQSLRRQACIKISRQYRQRAPRGLFLFARGSNGSYGADEKSSKEKITACLDGETIGC